MELLAKLGWIVVILGIFMLVIGAIQPTQNNLILLGMIAFVTMALEINPFARK
jgi:uncharacterized membrane protein